MTVALGRSMTQAEFLDWAQAQEGRYEFDGVGPVAMTGGSGNHARIIGNIAFAAPPAWRCRAVRGADVG